MAKKPWVRPRWRDEGAALDLQRAEDEVTRAIQQVLDELPADVREAAMLRLRDQLTTAQITDRLGLTARKANAHIARATRLMRKRLPEILAAQEPRATEAEADDGVPHCAAGCGYPVMYAGDVCGECACEDDCAP